MSKRNRSQAHGRGAAARREKRQQALPWSVRLRSMSDLLLHPASPDERPWKFLLPVLALAFVARAAIALSGDFVLHPDEIMQYLEPAHRLVFGNGVTYWEYFYGARSWLVPGLVAGVLKLFDIVGLGQPLWYVGGVKLVFCAISLLIPAGMYFFARWHFGETAARVALLMGAFWYELVGFAHKPMTEFVATALLMSLLALCVRPASDRLREVVLVAVLAVLVAAIRVQYAPLALLVLGLFFLRTEKKMQLALAAAAVFVAVGVFDAITWDGSLFHSYIVNIRVNLALGDLRAGESPAWQFLYWILIASMGLVALCVLALPDLRRYGFLVTLIALTLLIHSAQSHKEYRFIFVVIPLWLLIGADFVVWFASRASEGQVAHVVGADFPRADGILRSDFSSRHPECVAVSRQSVSGLFKGDRYRRLPAQSGSDFRRVPLSCQRARGHCCMAGGSPLFQPSWLLLSASRDTVLRRQGETLHIRGPRKDRARSDSNLGQPHRVGGPGHFCSRLLGGKNIRHHPNSEPRCGRAGCPPMARVHPDDHRWHPFQVDEQTLSRRARSAA